MRRIILLLATAAVMAAMLLACSGVVLAQSTEQPTPPEKGAQASNSRVNADDTDNRGSPKLKQPVQHPSEESVSGQQTTSPVVAQEATTQPTSAPKANGAWIQDVWLDPAGKITEFTNLVGTAPHVIMYYQNWHQLDKKSFDPAKMQTVVDKGAMPMVTWAPRDPAKGVNQSRYALRTIIAGNHDSYIRQWAKDAAAWGKSCQAKGQLASPCTMYLRFAHEMNGTWFPWSPGVNGNTSSEFRSAWKRVHGIFQQEGATNVRWVWSPHVNCGGCSSLKSVYPGDAYVDWTALDGYNWGTNYGNRWLTVAQIFGSSYDQITKPLASGGIAPSKPFMIAETSSAEQGGDKAAWITDAFSTDPTTHPGSIPNRMPLTKAVVWFSADKTAQGETNWRVDSSQKSLDAYKAAAKTTDWQGYLPQ
jgi:hypothetical protein